MGRLANRHLSSESIQKWIQQNISNSSVNKETQTMGLTISDNGKDFEQIPEGTHLAICYLVVDAGTQVNSYGKLQQKVIVGWEVPAERMDNGKPYVITQRYTASLNSKAALRRDLESWRGRAFTEEELEGFSLSHIIGKGCMLSVVHEESNGKTYANIKTVMGLPKGTTTGNPENKIVYFDMDEFDHDVFNELPSWMQDLINKSQERSPVALEVKQQTAADAFLEASAIPF
jgi:hypothetical protein